MNCRRPYQEPTVPPMMHAKRNRAKVSLIFHDFLPRLVRARTGRGVSTGSMSATQWAKEVGIVRDEEGYLVTGPDLRKFGRPTETWKLNREPYYLETSMPGVFAAGDVRHGSIKRVASAVGEGAMVIAFVHRYLSSG